MSEVPILLVHGFASSFERNWREPGWVNVLEDEGRIVVGVDLLGHGTSAKPTDPSAYADLHSAIDEALDTHHLVDAVGFSLGGQLLLRLASKRPTAFRRLVVGGVGDSALRTSDSEALAVAVETGLAGDTNHEAAGAFARFARSPDNEPAALAACLRRPSSPLSVAELSTVACPVLVVLGDRDFAGPAVELVAGLPDARLVSLPGADHFSTPKDFRFLAGAVEFLCAPA
jgi:pimeloyl-ACP methyl ester carboxylesterase